MARLGSTNGNFRECEQFRELVTATPRSRKALTGRAGVRGPRPFLLGSAAASRGRCWRCGLMRYQVLGPVAVAGEEGPLRLGGPKQRAVLAALLLHANQVVSDEQLCSLVWGKRAPANVRGQLQIHISGLRKLLGHDTILRRPPGYLIKVAPGELDLEVFSTSVEQAMTDLASGQTERASERLRGALGLWSGPALGGVAETLAEHEAQSLQERRLCAFEQFFDAELALGRPARLVDDLRRLVREYPFREKLSWQFMLALYRSGRAPEALAAYSEIRLRLAAELGIDPGGRLQELHQRILRGEDGPAAAEPELREAVTPAELPHDVADFVGRAAELAVLDRDLERLPGEGVRVWVISGMAGAGKTALAVHWAHRVRARFPDGQLFVDLGGFGTGGDRHGPLGPAVVLAQVLRALGVPPERVPDRDDELARLYRSVLAGRKMLLVLDDACSAEQVRALLPGRSTLVLVTSRDRLGDLAVRDGARTLPVPPLAAAESRALLTRLLGPRRVAAEPAAVAELARRCGHLPLALRIAAAELGTDYPVGLFLAELEDGVLEGLTVAGAEHTSVAAAFAASYDRLPPELKRQFRRLALIRGDITGEALALLEPGAPVEAHRRLRALAAVNLVEQHGRDRYRLHELMRPFALARLAADEPSPASLPSSHAGVAGRGEGLERQPDGGHHAQVGVVLAHGVEFAPRQRLAEQPELVQRAAQPVGAVGFRAEFETVGGEGVVVAQRSGRDGCAAYGRAVDDQ
ncbi:hypothetical protein FNH05_24725 [Amycolatopsis rhizosphaerae]|uniref:OmpR/PhoB-type domain-containing protein n=1 Tax=Amycolatopsis rhizosphaerae TaxID=2053003 RepID=A0A558BNB1_9PSEU|nr:hypothetical protein FNH05_24725 [Amycolatopsis rhizosphaerae]